MAEDLSIRELRLQKLARLRELGADPYSVERFETTASNDELLARYEELEGQKVRLAGRIVSYRLMGKAAFAHLSDGETRLQVYFRRDDLGERDWEIFDLLDIGDHLGVEGELFTTRTGERSVHARSITPLSKSLHVLPLGKEKDGEQWYGLHDVDTRYRHRHLDLVCNPEARRVLLLRSRIVSAVRSYFDAAGYLEVETPLLQLEAGGAAATPFTTMYHAYETEVKLRISLELYLKRVLCGDVGRVYEIGRVFRNEGVSNRHNPEFTLLEFYEAYASLEDMMVRVEELFRHVATTVFGGETPVDFSKPWRRVELLAEISRTTGLPQQTLTDFDAARKAMAGRKWVHPVSGRQVVPEEEPNLGGLLEKLLETYVEPELQEPTFVVGYPLETSPLAKKDPNRPGFTRRFEGYVLGREICNAFGEINDPVDQRERFEAQARQRLGGQEETHPMDEDFLFALESGMPPTGGCGIGIDRLVMLLTGAHHIREVLLFPMMRPDLDA